MRRVPRSRRNPALLRGRYRVLFFILLAAAALVLSHQSAAIVGALGVLAGLASVRVARRRGGDLAHTFAVLDWLLLGCALALSGGTASWLLPAVPLLATGQLAVADRGDRAYLLASSLVLVIVMAIADPSLGGDRLAGLLELAVLIGGGVAAAGRLRRPPARRRTGSRVDDVTGLYTASRLEQLLAGQMAAALESHEPLSVVYLRLEHFEDARNFMGPQGSDDLLRGVARRLQRRLGADALAFRVRPDALLASLPGVTLGEARELAAAVCHDVSANLIAGRRQTLAVGASSFPTVRQLSALLAAAEGEAAALETGVAVPRAVPLAAAQ